MQVQQVASELDALGVRVLVVTFENAARARAYAEEIGCPWPILVDEGRQLYRAYGMGRARWRDLWGPATWWAYGQEALRGRLPRRPHGDPTQQGGDVLIDPAGIVRLQHVGRGPADRPAVEQLLRVVREGSATEGR